MPSRKKIQAGFAPQLPLEAAIALGDTGFPNLSGREIEALRDAKDWPANPPTSKAARPSTGK